MLKWKYSSKQAEEEQGMDPLKELKLLWEERNRNASFPGDLIIWELSTVSLNVTEQEWDNETSTDILYLDLFSQQQVLLLLSLLISLLGLLGNGFVFWFLCFQIKQKKFMVYFLNLALADLIFLFSLFVLLLYILVVTPGIKLSLKALENHTWPFIIVLVFTYLNGLFLLTAISVERCLSVQFPIWYHCRRPKHQSAIVCFLLWGLSCLMTMLDYSFCHLEDTLKGSLECRAVNITLATLSFGVVLPVMVSSNLIFIIKIWRRPQQHSPQKIYVVIVATVLTFLVFVVPGQLWNLLVYLNIVTSDIQSVINFFSWNTLCCTINSTANPFIYFLAGRKRKPVTKGFITEAFQRVFREETETPKRDVTLASNIEESIV
ncbi:mas-related G-protein coupled receptor member H-like [Microcaecilia unicolor]|uniref:Mas-related G-protein coupled receptor member H-like n=1 Tax=Microcaecilia unicolor TaxID=1415580 RepID=A0A6P7X3U6_9AMPH|nr:mas-related G-protein coupled receptor member H-like [Microcaecilia unicolor]